MKSLRRSTPLVRTKSSSGGSDAVYMWSLRVSVVMDSGLGRWLVDEERVRRLGEGESGGRVVDDESPASSSLSMLVSSGTSSSSSASRMVGRGSLPSSWLDRIFWRMREGEKGVFLGGGGLRKSWTVLRMAVVISARDVYGKQMLRTVLRTGVSFIVWETAAASTDGILVVVLGPSNGFVNNLEDVFPDHLTLTEDAHAGAVAV